MEPKKPRDPSLRQSKEALLEAAQAAIKDQRNRPPAGLRPPPTPGVGRQVFRGVLVVLIAAGAVMVAVRPPWLSGPSMPAETPTIRAASATLSLVDAISKVEAHFTAKGTLPARLTDVGVPNSGIRYKILDTSAFEVSLATPDTTIVLRSTDGIKARTIDAIRTLQGRS